MLDPKCKICRRAGEKLFLKGDRCDTPKCAMVRKPYPPGAGGKGMRRPKRLSEYGIQLRTKQKMKMMYGMRERAFANYVKKAITQKTDSGKKLIELLESRTDNAVFRLGLAQSRSVARQVVGHGHIFVNGRRCTIPSRELRVGDVISVRPQSENKKVFSNLDIFLKKYNPPAWLNLDKSKKEGTIISKPLLDRSEIGININAIIEFYSR